MSNITSASKSYNFVTMNDAADPTFNQLLGINNINTIVGYFGSGETGHPNQGYILKSPNYLTNITNANYPNSAQTQQIGVNDNGVSCGFYADNDGNNFGFVYSGGTYTSVTHPDTGNGTVNQLLGLNLGYAVGFYTDGSGVNHGYSYNIATATFASITPPSSFNCASTTATSTNSNGDVVGFCETATNTTVSFYANSGNYIMFSVPGSTNTQAFGINQLQTVVGSYVDEAGDTHGFVATSVTTSSPSFRSLDHPSAVGSTILNGINDAGSIVGFYVDAAGNTNGVLATANGTGTASVAAGSGVASGTAVTATAGSTAAGSNAAKTVASTSTSGGMKLTALGALAGALAVLFGLV
ncbi:hypothetical protein HDU84_007662 [Entophlyctis sp. JEL0112]|nr:hypothetical protein HDU84_007662 [Entophlyctis sp. JEL0112]